MGIDDREEGAHCSFERRMWGDAFAELWAAHRERQLGVELERLAVAAYMVGRDDACEEAWMGAHHAWVGRGEAERAAGCAFWQALGLFFRGRAVSGDGMGRPRWAAVAGQQPRLRRAGLAADAHRVAAPVRGRCGSLSELRRGGGDRRTLRRSRRDDVRPARSRILADPAGTKRRGHGGCWTRSWSPSRQTRSRRCSPGSPTVR
jgi:hypothetical protein